MTASRTRIKICGLTRPQDALAAAAAGADALGLVFHEPSPRSVSLEQAKSILQALPPFVSSVALFVNPERSAVEQVLEKLRPDCLQFHGEEPDDFCHSFGRPFIKAVRMKPGINLPQAIAAYPHARAVLLDAWHEHEAGGTGRTFDWDALAASGVDARQVILAGGLNQDNVAAALVRFHPYAVDVSSGVESAPGIKSDKKIQAFVSEVTRVGSSEQ